MDKGYLLLVGKNDDWQGWPYAPNLPAPLLRPDTTTALPTAAPVVATTSFHVAPKPNRKTTTTTTMAILRTNRVIRRWWPGGPQPHVEQSTDLECLELQEAFRKARRLKPLGSLSSWGGSPEKDPERRWTQHRRASISWLHLAWPCPPRSRPSP